MSIGVGSQVTFYPPQKAEGLTGSVLELRGEHALCRFADGRNAWVPLASLVLQPAVAQPQPFSQPNPAWTSAPVPTGQSQDTPLSQGLIALIYLGLAVVPLGCTMIGAIAFSIPYYVWRKEQPKRAKQWQTHVWIAFGIGCALWFGIFMVAGAITGVAKYKEAASADKVWNDGLCELHTPGTWVRQEPPQSPDASLEVQNRIDDVFVVIVSEPAQDFDPNLDVERYAALALSEKVRPFKVLERDFVPLGSERALREVRAGVMDGLQMTFEHHFFRSEQHFHQVVAGSKTRTFPTQRPKLEAVINSIRCGSARAAGTK